MVWVDMSSGEGAIPQGFQLQRRSPARFTVLQHAGNEEVMVFADDQHEVIPNGMILGMDTPMLHTKACPRCAGDLALVEDVGDTYFSCVQCGYVNYQVRGGPQQLTPAVTPTR